ncbi:MAG: 3-oxoacid CoA-transferase subunit B [Planctomycetota bacterium]|jgi:3-oxoacid CoA-transferase subunit B
MKKKLSEEMMALRASKEFEDGDVVNLGAGIPGLCATFIREGHKVMFESENGALGYGGIIKEDKFQEVEVQYIDAGGRYFLPKAGMSFFDMGISFDLMRGGRLDITCLGAYQVSERGDLANWSIPGDASMGIGGGMDLVYGARRVIVIMEHVTKNDEFKILKKCTYPLTGKECVSLIVTNIAVIEPTEEGLVLREFAPGWTAEEIQRLTEPKLIVADDLKAIEL